MKQIKKAMFFLLIMLVLYTTVATVDARANNHVCSHMNMFSIKNNIAVVVTPVITIVNVFSFWNSGNTNTNVGVNVNVGTHQ